ncbi:F0F1 ATP synthase subunit delta [Candidatus Saccharibacteria bacterium]|nr:F0F1 ATP synthase subunit delta [Candidatus Saccharibacteria bacterium]
MAYKLPANIANRTQLRHLQRLLGRLKTGMKVNDPDLNALLSENGIKSLNLKTVQALKQFVSDCMQTAAEISVFLASAPSDDETAELVQWLRGRLQPNLLVHIVQSPEILAGCIVRTDRSIYDLSLRQALTQNKQLLIKALHNV